MLDLLFPERCVLCQVPPRRLCGSCHDQLRPSVRWHTVGAHALVVSGGSEKSMLAVIRAFKDECRTGLSRELSAVLHPAFEAAVAKLGIPDVWVVPPSSWSSWRRRGFRPVPLLLKRSGIRAFPALARRRFRTDQRGLDLDQRERNVAEAFYATKNLRGARVIIVDDVVTTGATVREAARALEAAGASVLCLVALVRVAPRREK